MTYYLRTLSCSNLIDHINSNDNNLYRSYSCPQEINSLDDNDSMTDNNVLEDFRNLNISDNSNLSNNLSNIIDYETSLDITNRFEDDKTDNDADDNFSDDGIDNKSNYGNNILDNQYSEDSESITSLGISNMFNDDETSEDSESITSLGISNMFNDDEPLYTKCLFDNGFVYLDNYDENSEDSESTTSLDIQSVSILSDLYNLIVEHNINTFPNKDEMIEIDDISQRYDDVLDNNISDIIDDQNNNNIYHKFIEYIKTLWFKIVNYFNIASYIFHMRHS